MNSLGEEGASRIAGRVFVCSHFMAEHFLSFSSFWSRAAIFVVIVVGDIWAVTRQNQQLTVCRAKTQISLGICPVWTESSLSTQWVAKTQAFFMRTTKTLVRLGGCPSWSESSLDAHAILLVLSCGGSFVISFQDKSIVKPCRLPYPM